jgi:hypothetical protein
VAKFIETLTETLGGRVVLRTLKTLERNRTPVRLEVESSDYSFYTVLSLRPEVVVVARPADLEPDILQKGGMVRFIVPDASKNVVRMHVIEPEYKRERGDSVIVCRIPDSFAEKSKRGADRFNTSRFKNLLLIVPQLEAEFRIIDMSHSGCKVFVQDFEEWETLKAGAGMRFTKVAIGEKVEIDLDMLTPRLINAPMVSFAWEVSGKGDSAKYLNHMISSLHRAEVGRLKIKERAPGKPREG